MADTWMEDLKSEKEPIVRPFGKWHNSIQARRLRTRGPSGRLLLLVPRDHDEPQQNNDSDTPDTPDSPDTPKTPDMSSGPFAGGGPSNADRNGAITSLPEPEGNLSQGTEHLLIAFAAIFSTLVFLLLAFVGYRWYKGVPLRDAFKLSKPTPRRRRGQMVQRKPLNWGAGTGVGQEGYTLPYDGQTMEEKAKDLPAPPRPALRRSSTQRSADSSTGLLQERVAVGSRPSGIARAMVSNKAMPDTPIINPFLQNPPTPIVNAPPRANVITTQPSEQAYTEPPESPILPLPTMASSEFDPYFISSSDNSSLPSIPPLNPHKHTASGQSRYTNTPMSLPKLSRFSWTTSGDPQTPHTPATRMRESIRTSVTSAPRWRSVESWVAGQTGRVEKEQAKVDREQGGNVPEVPEVPKEYKHKTARSDATVFKVHPGTEVVIQNKRVPSEILDRGVGARRSKGI